MASRPHTPSADKDSIESPRTAPPERKLDLSEAVRLLVADGRLSQDDAAALTREGRAATRAGAHPLTVIADKGFKDLRPPHKSLTAEALTQWLA